MAVGAEVGRALDDFLMRALQLVWDNWEVSFASLVGMVDHDVPRLLINRERVGEGDLFMNPRGFDWESPTDGFYGGDCDAAVDHAGAAECADVCRRL